CASLHYGSSYDYAMDYW
nr:immunoglobulin heavy chain junction region [Mus musculus]NSM09424.1 immunoglobulin heavy chain junction region [Mus musculus]